MPDASHRIAEQTAKLEDREVLRYTRNNSVSEREERDFKNSRLTSKVYTITRWLVSPAFAGPSITRSDTFTVQ
jgi:hypothetical protein